MLITKMIFWKTVPKTRNTGRLRNMYSEVLCDQCQTMNMLDKTKSLSKSCYGLY